MARAAIEADLAMDRFAKNVDELKKQFVKAFGPLLDDITKLLQALPDLTGAFKVLGAVLIATFVASGITSFLKLLGSAVAGAQAIAKAFGSLGSSGVASSAGKLVQGLASGGTSNFQRGLKGVGSAAGIAIGGALGVSGMFGSKEADAEKQAAIDAEQKKRDDEEEKRQKAFVDAYNAKAEAIKSVGNKFKDQGDAASAAYQKETANISQSKTAQEIAKKEIEIDAKVGQATDQLLAKKATLSEFEKKNNAGALIDKQIEKVKALGEAQKQQAAADITAKTKQQVLTDAIKITEERRLAIGQAVADIEFSTKTAGLLPYQKAIEDVKRKEDEWLTTTIARAAAEEKISSEEYAIKYPQAVAKFTAEATKRVKEQTDALKDNNSKLREIDDFTASNARQLSIQDQLLEKYQEIDTRGLSPLEKAYKDIDAQAQKYFINEIRRRDAITYTIDERKAGKSIATDPTQMNQLRAAASDARMTSDEFKNLATENDQYARKFSTGWNKAFKQYVDDANNAAKQAERLFNKAFQGIEDLLVNFVKTGKFEWKSFVASMAEELLRSQIKQLLGNIGKGLFGGGIGGGGGGPAGTSTDPMFVQIVGAGAAGIFGGASGASPFGGMFGGGQDPMISGGGIGGGQKGGGMFDGLSNIFGGITDTIGSVFGGIGDTIGSVFGGGGDSGGGFFDGITSLFDGFFAGGGSIGAGKFGVVGENGPELVGGPANVAPMAGSTNVTYNINAVDAASFKAMIARDPSFIHAVAMQGAKGIPGRY